MHVPKLKEVCRVVGVFTFCCHPFWVVVIFESEVYLHGELHVVPVQRRADQRGDAFLEVLATHLGAKCRVQGSGFVVWVLRAGVWD